MRITRVYEVIRASRGRWLGGRARWLDRTRNGTGLARCMHTHTHLSVREDDTLWNLIPRHRLPVSFIFAPLSFFYSFFFLFTFYFFYRKYYYYNTIILYTYTCVCVWVPPPPVYIIYTPRAIDGTVIYRPWRRWAYIYSGSGIVRARPVCVRVCGVIYYECDPGTHSPDRLDWLGAGRGETTQTADDEGL